MIARAAVPYKMLDRGDLVQNTARAALWLSLVQ